MGIQTSVYWFFGAPIENPPENIHEIAEELCDCVAILEGDSNEVVWYMYLPNNLEKIHDSYYAERRRYPVWYELGMGEHEPSTWWHEQADEMSELADEHGLTLGDWDHYITVCSR